MSVHIIKVRSTLNILYKKKHLRLSEKKMLVGRPRWMNMRAVRLYYTYSILHSATRYFPNTATMYSSQYILRCTVDSIIYVFILCVSTNVVCEHSGNSFRGFFREWTSCVCTQQEHGEESCVCMVVDVVNSAVAAATNFSLILEMPGVCARAVAATVIAAAYSMRFDAVVDSEK